MTVTVIRPDNQTMLKLRELILAQERIAEANERIARANERIARSLERLIADDVEPDGGEEE